MEQAAVKAHLLQRIGHVHDAKGRIHVPVVAEVDEKDGVACPALRLRQILRPHRHLCQIDHAIAHIFLPLPGYDTGSPTMADR